MTLASGSLLYRAQWCQFRGSSPVWKGFGYVTAVNTHMSGDRMEAITIPAISRLSQMDAVNERLASIGEFGSAGNVFTNSLK